jgi:hypothetical protein
MISMAVWVFIVCKVQRLAGKKVHDMDLQKNRLEQALKNLI